MAWLLSTTIRNAVLNQMESSIGTVPLLRLYTGSAPATPAATATGTLIVEITLPSDWMAAAASGSKVRSGTWSALAVAAGTPGYFRIYDSGGATCHMQGTVTITGGGGDMTLDNITINDNQTVTVGTFTMTAGNA